MAQNPRENDLAWSKVFDSIPVVEGVEAEGFFVIKSDDLKSFREPRLMAKLDTDSDRPKVFRDHHLNILPLDRRRYVIFRDQKNVCYFQLPPDQQVNQPKEYRTKVDLAALDTLSNSLNLSESEAIDQAFLSSMLSSFCGTQNLVLTRRGRFGSGEFFIKLPDSNVSLPVRNAQIEVDSIFESSDQVVLIEAKTRIRSDFHIRQLFYPYQWLQGKTTKSVKVVLFCYSNGLYQFNEFTVGNEFGDLRLVKQDYFVLNENPVADINLSVILKYAPSPQEDMSIPFPQANDLNKVIDIVSAIDQGFFRVSDFAEYFGFVERQVSYYLSAARYLGFIGTIDHLGVTPVGLRLTKEKSRLNRTEIVLKSLISRPVFRDCIILLEHYGYNPTAITTEEIGKVISTYRSDISGDTVARRASTVRNWLNWLVANIEFAK